MDLVRAALLTAAAMTGAIGWCGRFQCLPLAALVLVLWRTSRSRIEALGVAVAYYGAASFDWMPATSTFFGSAGGYSAEAIALWVGGAALLSLPWGLCWSKRLKGSAASRLARGALLGLALMLPPLGLVSWCNPWVAASSMLPGLGLLAFGLVTLVAFAPGGRSAAWWVALWLLVSSAACARYAPPSAFDWVGISTRDGRLLEADVSARYDRALSAGLAAKATGAKVVLFPEGVAGRWTRSTVALWAGEAGTGQVWLVGAIESHRGALRNGLAIVRDGTARFWSQRVPAPIGMWAPWRSAHVKSDLVGSSIREIAERRAALLLCFEQFVSWPALQTALEAPDVVLAPANLWFAKRTNLNAVRDVTLQSWAALMGWPVVEAING